MYNPEQQKSEESAEDRNARMAKGQISEEEISEYLTHPEDVLFEHHLTNEKSGEETLIKVRYLTRQFLSSTFESLKDSWDKPSFENLKTTLEKHFEQKESGKPGLLNAEYYIATDENDNPIGMTGLYTIDIQGGAGFATRDKLDPEDHYLNIGLGWYSVNKKAQGIGLGKYLFQWSENFAKSRGAHCLEIETDDWTNSKRAVQLYKKMGYEVGYPVKNFYGPGRDFNVYYYDCEKDKDQGEVKSEQTTEITEGNKTQILQIAQESYSPERFKEFKACLDLFLSQNKETDSIMNGHSLVVLGEDGKPKSFSIYADYIYDNNILVYWFGVRKGIGGAKENLLSSLRSVAIKNNRYVIIINTEGQDTDLLNAGFTEAKKGVPGVFAKGDATRFLLFSKEL